MTDTEQALSLSELPDDAREAIEATARGTYQRALLAGDARWSGADIKGRARQWGARYAIARDGLLARVRTVAAKHGYDAQLSGGTAKTGPLALIFVPVRKGKVAS